MWSPRQHLPSTHAFAIVNRPGASSLVCDPSSVIDNGVVREREHHTVLFVQDDHPRIPQLVTLLQNSTLQKSTASSLTRPNASRKYPRASFPKPRSQKTGEEQPQPRRSGSSRESGSRSHFEFQQVGIWTAGMGWAPCKNIDGRSVDRSIVRACNFVNFG